MEIKKLSDFMMVSENLKWHIDSKTPLMKNVFRPNSDAFYDLLKEARELYDNNKISLTNEDKEIYDTTDLGKFHHNIPLDLPMYNESVDAELNKPMRNSSGGKKYKVYVKNPKTGNVKTVYFGDMKGGLTSKISDPAARKSFVARHKCETEHKDKTKAGYWSCRLPRFAHLLGLKGGGNFYW